MRKSWKKPSKGVCVFNSLKWSTDRWCKCWIIHGSHSWTGHVCIIWLGLSWSRPSSLISSTALRAYSHRECSTRLRQHWARSCNLCGADATMVLLNGVYGITLEVNHGGASSVPPTTPLGIIWFWGGWRPDMWTSMANWPFKRSMKKDVPFVTRNLDVHQVRGVSMAIRRQASNSSGIPKMLSIPDFSSSRLG